MVARATSVQALQPFWHGSCSARMARIREIGLRGLESRKMPIYSVHHVTTYHYRQPVAFGEHRMMFLPREGHDQHLLSSTLRIIPEPSSLRLSDDALGNRVGVALLRPRDGRLRKPYPGRTFALASLRPQPGRSRALPPRRLRARRALRPPPLPQAALCRLRRRAAKLGAGLPRRRKTHADARSPHRDDPCHPPRPHL